LMTDPSNGSYCAATEDTADAGAGEGLGSEASDSRRDALVSQSAASSSNRAGGLREEEEGKVLRAPSFEQRRAPGAAVTSACSRGKGRRGFL
jgi:hypothetical protein